MPRIGRILPEEGLLHILARGNNRQQIFRYNVDYKVYLQFLKKYKQENDIAVYHYCIMQNHVHIIVAINPGSSLSRFEKQLNLSYFQYFSRKYEYDGHLWQGRFKSLIISKDEYLVRCGRYIELNPVKAQLVKKPKDYMWSSYNHYAYGITDSVITYNPIYLDLRKGASDRQKNYRECIGEEIETINFNARFFGSNEFIKKMEKKFGVNNVRLNRGRPKKVKK